MGARRVPRPVLSCLISALRTVSMEDDIAQKHIPVRCQLIQRVPLFPVCLPAVLFGSVSNGFHLSGDLLEFFEHGSAHSSTLVVRLLVGNGGLLTGVSGKPRSLSQQQLPL